MTTLAPLLQLVSTVAPPIITTLADLAASMGGPPLFAAASSLEQHGNPEDPDCPAMQAWMESVPGWPALVYVQLTLPLVSLLQLEGLQKPSRPVFGPERTLKPTWTLAWGTLF